MQKFGNIWSANYNFHLRKLAKIQFFSSFGVLVWYANRKRLPFFGSIEDRLPILFSLASSIVGFSARALCCCENWVNFEGDTLTTEISFFGSRSGMLSEYVSILKILRPIGKPLSSKGVFLSNRFVIERFSTDTTLDRRSVRNSLCCNIPWFMLQ